VSAPASITVTPLPTVTLSSGSNSQTVNSGTAITPIVYTASNATTISLTGALPTGVSSSVSGTVLTISGTPAATGAFTYTVASSHTNGCVSSTTLAGTITVNAAPSPPTLAASTQTWSYGSLTWSDRIIIAACNKESFTSSTITPDCRSYNDNGTLRYYYNWPYVNANKSTMCPSSDRWRVPTRADFDALIIALGGSTTYPILVSAWGLGGYFNANGVIVADTVFGAYWSSTNYDEWNTVPTAYRLEYSNYDGLFSNNASKSWGLQVRCVKTN
jgi:hypothetical protein